MNVAVRVKPRSSAPAVGGTYGDGELVVAVTEPATDGRATEATLRAVAGAFGVSRRAVRLAHGATWRSKVVEVDGDDEELGLRKAELLRRA